MEADTGIHISKTTLLPMVLHDHKGDYEQEMHRKLPDHSEVV